MKHTLSALFLFHLTASILLSQVNIAFDHLTIKHGLSDGRIDCILQDSYGFLWFGTQDGLNRYDGYDFTVFDHDVFDSTSISSNWIRCILEDSHQQLWIGTEGGGLNRFNYKTETFTRWTSETGHPGTLSDNFVRTLVEDTNGKLWIGTRSGLGWLNRETDTFTVFNSEPGNPESPPFNENISRLYADSKNRLWIGTSENLYQYSPVTQTLDRMFTGDEAERIVAIYEDGYGNIWVGSRYQGLKMIDADTRKITRYRHVAENPKSLSSNEIKDIFEDNDENLWIATMHGGLNLYNRKTGQFQCFQHDPRDPSSLSSNSVRTIYEDRTHVLWIGMDGSGIDSFVKNKHKFRTWGNRPDSRYRLGNSTVLSILEDTQGQLWIGTEGGGLTLYDNSEGIRLRCMHQSGDPYSISSNQVTSILEDHEGTLWIGTKEGLNKYHKENALFHRYYVTATPITGNNFINTIFEYGPDRLLLGTNGGLIQFDKKTGSFTHLDYDPDNILNREVVVTVFKSSDDDLWIGYLRSGLVVYHESNGNFTHYRSDPEIPNSLSNNFVQYLFQDHENNLWIATRKGLNRFDPESRQFHRYTKADGLPSNVIVSILEDSRGNLWLGTTNGLSRFNTREKTFTNYNADDGLQGNQFWIRSCFHSRSGELYFGGNNGFNSFFPGYIEKLANPNIPPVAITDITVLNRPLHFSPYHVDHDTVRLSHNENQIAFEFASLDFTRPEKNQYAYRLEGFDPDWIYTGTRRYVNFTNLDPGQYTFRVKGTNNDGVWNEKGASVTFQIPTPLWKTAWAYLAYLVLALGLLYTINAYILGMVRVKHDLKIERMERENAREINQFKLQFFTDVAHEFKTPLTLIQSPLEDMLESLKNNNPFAEEMRLMHRNVRYLLRLIQQLLYFRRAEQGRMALEVSRGNVVQFSREIFELFTETARKHQIDYQFETAADKIAGWFDWEKLEEILVNLLDNAFKYTPDQGRIALKLSCTDIEMEHKGLLHIHIADSGTGIQPDQIDQIFQRFYNPLDNHHRSTASSGLGLALTKKLVELHHGTISVVSIRGKGSDFHVELPLGRAHLEDRNIVTQLSETSHFRSTMRILNPESALITESSGIEGDIEKPLLLIVEDNEDLRCYMKKTLSNKYRIAEAGNGREGLEKAGSLSPQLIISDVMMPEMDGIELCQHLKNELKTSHIPVILLTAKNEIEQKIEGFETGADDYIEKPFHFRFLEARIKNILQSRETLRERYRKELLMEPNPVKAVSHDEKLIAQIRDYVENHISDSDLDIKHLANDMGLSRTMLFIKLKSLTGYTPSEFMKILRLKSAAQYLKESDLTISEIAYRVGFKYPKYFSTCFLQQYGRTPSEYREQKATQSV